MVIFDKFLRQNLIKIYAKNHQIASFYKIFSGQHGPKPPSTSVKNLAPPPPLNLGYDPVIRVYTRWIHDSSIIRSSMKEHRNYTQCRTYGELNSNI